MAVYTVIVGNIGMVLETDEQTPAHVQYSSWVELSQESNGRVAGESVTLFKDGEILREYGGTIGTD